MLDAQNHVASAKEPPALSGSAFPPTRYQGSKRKLAGIILGHLQGVPFTTALDAFGGTGSIAYALKRIGKRVVYNDLLTFNHQIGLALIENDSVRLSEEDMDFVQMRHDALQYDDFIERTFDGIYFTREENRWLDTVCQNIPQIACPFRRALAWFATFQSAMIKRPYNLFHRRNLSMRLNKVERSFGNKATWEVPFTHYFKRFANQGNDAVIDTGGLCRASCVDAMDIDNAFDLVYIDTPYIKRNGVGTDYHAFYHFLEGMVRYHAWADRIDLRYKHFPLRDVRIQPWSRPDQAHSAFERLYERFQSSILCVSYRSDGIPSIDDLCNLLRRYKRKVRAIKLGDYRYALSPNRDAGEILLIGS